MWKGCKIALSYRQCILAPGSPGIWIVWEAKLPYTFIPTSPEGRVAAFRLEGGRELGTHQTPATAWTAEAVLGAGGGNWRPGGADGHRHRVGC